MDRVQTASKPGESSTLVRGLVLPVLLASLLASGRWQHPGDDVLRSALPWFEDPLVFLRTAGAMESVSASLEADADDDRASRYFHVTRGTGHRLGLPWLDARLALLIAVNRSPRGRRGHCPGLPRRERQSDGRGKRCLDQSQRLPLASSSSQLRRFRQHARHHALATTVKDPDQHHRRAL